MKGEGRAQAPGYKKKLPTPGSMQDEEDSSGDDDEEDIGKDHKPTQNLLDYDSDEKVDSTGDAEQELISLDNGKNKRKKKVPKLKKPTKWF